MTTPLVDADFTAIETPDTTASVESPTTVQPRTAVPSPFTAPSDDMPEYLRFLYRVARLHDQPRSAGELAALRNALIPAAETFAFPFTEPSLSGLTAPKRVAARRAAGIIASHKGSFSRPAGDGGKKAHTLGAAFSRLYHLSFNEAPGQRDSNGQPKQNAISMQVNALPLLPLEEAVNAIALLVGRCAGHKIPVSVNDLARTLLGWGDGISPDSMRTRHRVVEQFYGARD